MTRKKDNPQWNDGLNLESLPTGLAPDTVTPGCMVLEGGGFRGLYTSGALDCLMEHGINLSCVLGVSAGALNGVNYVSGQIGRSARANLGFRHDKNYIGMPALRKSRSLIRLDFLIYDLEELLPLDKARFADPRRRFVAVTADIETGQAEYMDRDTCPDIMQAVKASATLPGVGPAVEVGGRFYLDGGCVTKLPYAWAVEQGFEKIVMIKTQAPDYRKKIKQKPVVERLFRKNPEFLESLRNVDTLYNRQCDELAELAEKGRIFLLQPEEPVDISRIEGNIEKLTCLYWRGYRETEKRLPELKAYLGIS